MLTVVPYILQQVILRQETNHGATSCLWYHVITAPVFVKTCQLASKIGKYDIVPQTLQRQVYIHSTANCTDNRPIWGLYGSRYHLEKVTGQNKPKYCFWRSAVFKRTAPLHLASYLTKYFLYFKWTASQDIVCMQSLSRIGSWVPHLWPLTFQNVQIRQNSLFSWVHILKWPYLNQIVS